MADGVARLLAGTLSCSSDNQGAEEKSDHAVVVVVVVKVVMQLTDTFFFIFIVTPYRCSGDRANQLEEMD